MAKRPTRKNYGPDGNALRLVAALTERGPQTRKQLGERLGIQSSSTLRSAWEHLCSIPANSRPDGPAVYDVPAKEAQLPEAALAAIGKRSKVLMLGPQGGYAIGVEIGRAHLSVGVGDANGCLLAPEVSNAEYSIDETSALSTFGEAARLVKKHLEACAVDPADVRGVGVSIPGPVSLEGRTLASNISPTFHDVDIPAKFAEKLAKVAGIDAEVFVENDVDVLARGEQRYGKGYGLRDFLVIKFSGGIGAGVVADERLVRGRGGGGGGEIGHCRVSPAALETEVPTMKGLKEPPCKCRGLSHLEAYAGGDAIVKRIAERQKNRGTTKQIDTNSSLPSQLEEAMTFAGEGSEPHLQVILDAATMTGYGTTFLIHLFNPEKVLVCGKLSELGKPLLEAIRGECQAQGLLFGEAEQIIELGAGRTVDERRRISVGGAVTTALRKAAPRFVYS